ncbi:hypothetical protein FJ872_30775 [Mesorhizobium sp. B2-5-9]|uniref:hypothetical protein n=1 Tax=Mesorhizobium sp. B2-5-9 TaxID=2589921 RepID=UPI001126A3AC|nr:hypothetical protein [Mesorhizobium sp. B2-5-9]TPJ99496.1 hypothetical protein FJ872_30775 [Mesorhizobium sp. B2-5-9]
MLFQAHSKKARHLSAAGGSGVRGGRRFAQDPRLAFLQAGRDAASSWEGGKMRYRALVAAAVLLATPGTASADTDTMAGIKAACMAEWPGDDSMQEYCIDDQVTSYNHLVQIHKGDQNSEEQHMLLKCLDQWKNATGSDWVMAEFCYQQKHEVYKRLREMKV